MVEVEFVLTKRRRKLLVECRGHKKYNTYAITHGREIPRFRGCHIRRFLIINDELVHKKSEQ